jgi:hypothetical protein
VIPFHCLPPKLDGKKNKETWWYGMEWIPSYSISFHPILKNPNNGT